MGRKAKVGKQRKDRFYQLAKETGYRSRAAFKLIQLNRKFEFLQRSKVLIDLCSAPGGWLQVAQKFMPVSSVIIGIDLVPIKPLPNVMTFQSDITSQQCRSLLRKELKTWKADVILNDGAPNVGKSWIHDAYAQIRLTLSAVQLASEFLMKGGWFVTKVFRSKDYNALMWLLSKLFKKVHATKPQASRHESAEIFVVCEKFLAPDRIDPKFFDPSYLFEDVTPPSDEKKKKAELLKPASKQKKAKAEGYADGDLTLYHKLNASEFMIKKNHLELLADSNEIVLDTEAIANHPLTNEDIKESCKDLKVLGRREILQLIAWRRKLRAELYPKEKDEKEEEDKLAVEQMPEEAEVEEEDEELAALKRKKKKILKERKKLNERMSLKMVLKDNELVEQDDIELFQLRHLKSRSALERFQDIGIDILNDQFDPESDSEEEGIDPKLKKVFFDRDAKDDYDFEDRFKDPKELEGAEDEEEEEKDNLDDEDNEEEQMDQDAPEDEEENEEGGGLLVDLDERPKSEKDRMFFQRGIFNEDEFEDEMDIKVMADESRKDRKKKEQESKVKQKGKSTDKKVKFAADDDDDDDYEDIDDDMPVAKSNDPFKEKCKLNVKLTPEELALGAVMIQSAKTRRDITDMAWNRYMHSDHGFLPSWFRKDEEVFFNKPTPVPSSTINEYKQKLKEINARPIKKVAEANARKRKRAQRKLERARKKAESLTESADMSEKEKMATIRNLYKKALKGEKKKEVTYVVAKKGKVNKRPAGMKGRYKLVDARMKKDKMKKKQELKESRGKKKTKKPGKPAKSGGKGAKPKKKTKY